ncbi:hydroxyproline O-arabinosyltransferase 3-like [Magnolia sinica]|uniref:hydroxyproline O-arabinosyltransferase 3-like n=1 Tax=Magnolia sinica TaxID=86752 RepID=UPI002658CF1C|nr:hydroxyproline O-arabinosyltransferase 3-like [Magnolia sinica]
MGRASLLFLLLLAFGFCFVTYNFLTMIIHNRTNNLQNNMVDSLDGLSSSFDPVVKMVDNVKISKGGKLPFHVAVTATDAPYSKWQCRIMYYWYKKVKDLPGSEMGGFTRVLHSGMADDLMDEIPTFVVDPLPAV